MQFRTDMDETQQKIRRTSVFGADTSEKVTFTSGY